MGIQTVFVAVEGPSMSEGDKKFDRFLQDYLSVDEGRKPISVIIYCRRHSPGLRRLLDSHQLEYHYYKLARCISLKAVKGVIEDLAKHPDVLKIIANPLMWLQRSPNSLSLLI